MSRNGHLKKKLLAGFYSFRTCGNVSSRSHILYQEVSSLTFAKRPLGIVFKLYNALAFAKEDTRHC